MAIEYQGELWIIQRWVSGFYNNAYLVTCNSTNKSVIIDTPDKPHELIAAAAETDVQAILITHNHWDHLEGFDVVTDRFKVPVGIGVNDAEAVAHKGRISRPDRCFPRQYPSSRGYLGTLHRNTRAHRWLYLLPATRRQSRLLTPRLLRRHAVPWWTRTHHRL